MRPTLAVAVILVLSCPAAASGGETSSVAPATRDGNGFLVHQFVSPFQSGKSEIRVLLPDALVHGRRYPTVYVLPVEALNEHRYGDGLAEIKKHNLQNKHQAIFVAPTFAQLPWYADHPTDPVIRQESHFVKVVLPFVEKNYPSLAERQGRLLLGFSKSGWGAWSLLLRYPDRFGRAAAWDAPLMLDRPGKYGSGEIFGTPENFAKYRISSALRERAADLRGSTRLVLLGYGGFRQELQDIHALMEELKLPHEYRDGPERKHDWHSGWVPEAVRALIGTSP